MAVDGQLFDHGIGSKTWGVLLLCAVGFKLRKTISLSTVRGQRSICFVLVKKKCRLV